MDFQATKNKDNPKREIILLAIITKAFSSTLLSRGFSRTILILIG
jgi:hypothetical protein